MKAVHDSSKTKDSQITSRRIVCIDLIPFGSVLSSDLFACVQTLQQLLEVVPLELACPWQLSACLLWHLLHFLQPVDHPDNDHLFNFVCQLDGDYNTDADCSAVMTQSITVEQSKARSCLFCSILCQFCDKVQKRDLLIVDKYLTTA